MPKRKKTLERDPVSRRAPIAPVALSLTREEQEGARQDYLDALPIAAAVLSVPDGEGPRIERANDHFRAIARWDERIAGSALGQVPLLNSGVIGDAVRRFIAGEQAVQQFEADDGEVIAPRYFTVRLARLGKPHLPERCLVSMIDRTAQVQTERNLRDEMMHDSLTGLLNRLAFNERIEAVFDDPAHEDGCYAVIVVDMTRFSRVNECMGAMAGDELLISFARRLLSALRAGDVLARTGGDEFGILTKLDRGIDDALQVGERIKSVLTTPFRLSELEIRVDCSVGCALIAESTQCAEEVLRNAQFALKRSKQSGRIESYEPSHAQAALRRFSIETELRRAIEADELRLAFQPLIDLPTGKVSGFEALARWDHSGRGPISPTEFIPVAEESGLILPLGRWAIAAAVQTLADWDRKAGRVLPLYVAVNLSAIQIARDDIAALAADALRTHNIDGGRLTLELTESAIIPDPVRAMTVLQSLKALGVKIAMDDFGTGYTSLANLQRLPIDVLKIDRSFVMGMLGNRDSAAIIRAVVSLADALGLPTTAEGIESEELAQALTALGCSHGQGFFFAEPLPADEALSYWLSRNA